MKKQALVLLLISACLALTFVTVPSAWAKNLKCDQVIVGRGDWPAPDPDPRVAAFLVTNPDFEGYQFGYWSGRVDFGGSLKGTAYFIVDIPGIKFSPSHTGHFYEWFYMAFDNGEWIMGNDHGTFNYLSNSMYMANGWVTGASANLQYLVGCKYHEEGKVGPHPLNPDWAIGVGTCFLAGA